jgi:hypothetical protein
MIRLELIEVAEPSDYALEDLKRYAAVADEAQGTLLRSALANAFDKVQRTADVALLPGRWKICAEDYPRVLNVYMGGRVVSVTDGNGNAVSFNQRGRRVYVGSDDYVEVEFTTEVIPAEYARLFPVVCQYATALYDGQTDQRVLNQILSQCL